MQEKSIKEAIDICLTNIQNSNINVIDKYELMLNINYFLTHYEEQTKSKVLKLGTRNKME